MYNQDPKVRRRRERFRYFGYGVATLATIVLAIASVYFVMGFRVDKTFKVEQGGLIKFDSRPRGAMVTLNGNKANVTQYQVNAVSGQHVVEYSRDGYELWDKTVTLHPGEVLWLEYAKLIPSLITTRSVADLPAVQQTLASPNREWLLLHETADSAAYSLIDARDERKPLLTKLALPETVVTAPEPGKASVFTLVSWSKDSTTVLVKHEYNDGQVEFIRLPIAQPDKAENITRLFTTQYTALNFADGSNAIFYGKTAPGELWRLDRGDVSHPALIARNVVSYDDLNDSAIAYATQAAEPNSPRVLYIWQRNGTRTKLRTVNQALPLSLTYNQYYSHTYLTEAVGGNVTIVEDPLQQQPKTDLNQSLSFVPAIAQASPGNRFIMMQNGESLAVYDIELDRLYTFTSPGEGRTPLQWADDHHLIQTSGSVARYVEFDGSNGHNITSVAGPYDVLMGSQGEVMLSIGKNQAGDGLQLQSSALLTPADQ